MAGRKPKPTALKKLEGNPGKRKLNTKEPMPGKGMPDCPKWLLPEEKKEWERLCEKLSEMGVLTKTKCFRKMYQTAKMSPIEITIDAEDYYRIKDSEKKQDE